MADTEIGPLLSEDFLPQIGVTIECFDLDAPHRVLLRATTDLGGIATFAEADITALSGTRYFFRPLERRFSGMFGERELSGMLRMNLPIAASIRALWATTTDLKLWKFNGSSWDEVNAAITFDIFRVNGANIIGAIGSGYAFSVDTGISFADVVTPEEGSDLDIAIDGTVWVIGLDPTDFGFAIWKSADQGASYTISYFTAGGLESILDGFFGPNIICHPTNSDTIAALQIDESGNLDLIKTTDGGANWSRLQLLAAITELTWGMTFLADGRIVVYGFHTVGGDTNLYRIVVAADLLSVESTDTDVEGAAQDITGSTWSQARGSNAAFFATTTEHNVVGGDPQEHLYRYDGSIDDEIALPINHASPDEGVVTWAVYDSVEDILYLAGTHTGESNVRLWKLPSPTTAVLGDFVEIAVPASGEISTMAVG